MIFNTLVNNFPWLRFSPHIFERLLPFPFRKGKVSDVSKEFNVQGLGSKKAWFSEQRTNQYP